MAHKLKIGDTVIALTNPENNRCQPRVKGNKYTVEHLLYCPMCGTQKINIGESTPKEFSDIHTCICGHDHKTGNRLRYTRSQHFCKADEIKTALEEAIASEDYEFAAKLRDFNR